MKLPIAHLNPVRAFSAVACGVLLLTSSLLFTVKAQAAVENSIKITSPPNGTVITATRFTASLTYSYKNWSEYWAERSYIQFRGPAGEYFATGANGNKITAQSGTLLYQIDMSTMKPGKYALIASLNQIAPSASSSLLVTDPTIITYQPPGVATATPTPTPTPTSTPKPSATTATPKPSTTAKPAPAAMYIYSDPGGADIYINGTYRTDTNTGASGVGFTDLTPGVTYRVVIKKDGYQDFTTDVKLAPNEIRDVRAKLVPGVTATGWIKVGVDPSGATVYINDIKLTTAPTTLTDVKPGTYRLTLKKEGFEDWNDTVTVVAGKTTEVFATLPPVDGGMSPVIPIAGGIAGTAAAAAIAKALLARKPPLPAPPKTAPPTTIGTTPTGEILLGTEMNGKVYYIHPGDEGGAYWMDKGTYQEIVNMQNQGLVYDKSLSGWMTRQDQADWVKAREHFREVSRQADIDRNARIQAELKAEKAARLAKAQYEAAKKDYIQALKERQGFLEQDQANNTYSAGNVLKTWGQNTSREVFTCRADDGSFSFKALSARVLADIGTLGLAEAVYAPVEVGYMTKDGMAEGKNFGHALNDALAFEALMQGAGWAGGKLITAGASAAARTATGEAAIAATKQALDPAITAFKNADAAFQKAWNGLTGAGKQALTASEQAAKDALTAGIKNGEKAAITDLYKEGGRKTLIELEKKGALSAQEAAHVNNIMKNEVNSAIDDATKNAIKNTEEATGVKVKEVLVGDSGSSAAGTAGKVRSINTDYDKTFKIRYDEGSLQSYANNHFGGDVKAAQEALDNQAFHKYLQEGVENNLKKSGLTPHDVDYKPYQGFGESAGQADAYPTGYTQVRQATQGNTTVYKPNADGSVNSYKTSGQAMTDQHALDLAAKGDTSQLATGGPKIDPKELPSLAKQQVAAINKAMVNDAKSACKALERMQKARELAGLPSIDPKLLNVVKQMNKAPQAAQAALGAQGQRDFVQMALKEITNGEKDILKILEMTGKATLR